MTAAVAGAARGAAAGGGRAAAGGGSAARRRRPRTIDERSQAAAERFDQRWSREGAGEKKRPGRRRRDTDGLIDAYAAGDRKKDTGSEGSGDRPTPPSSPSTTGRSSGPSVVSSGAGFLLALMFWSWIALPFLKGGPVGVRNMLRAKFFNKGPDGSWLP